MKRKSNRGEVKRRIRRGFVRMVEAHDQKNHEVITETRTWAGFPGQRDIVDLGNLEQSQKKEIDTLENKAKISWDGNGKTPVHLVFFGERTEKGFIPGRPWTEVARVETDFVGEFKDGFKSG